ncbi:hypothetical protein LPW36_02085 [Jinshanibacter sp. LJY008]|uniref:Pyocin large subunit n=1 Tax=Limnobaculum eriocheiris TaxID=2897391 RepID=A0A9X1SK29_9GAMM|nr:hypothetical protein [Limnobaculum eriocheiris]MCD1124834.1 hypothetical protein [Limnobaculum eriocheiris]
MAGDWIKMRTDLQTHPKVVRIASALKADRLRVIGALHATWCLFGAHSVDGIMEGYTPETLNEMIAFDNFAEVMISVGWLEFDGKHLSMPDFEAHNGQSAKRRAQEANRKKESRKTSASEADKMRTREEKRREEKNIKDQEILHGEKNLHAGTTNDEIFISLPLNDGNEFPVSISLVAELSELYPAVDIHQELRKQRGWLLAEPRRRKTSRGIQKFINTWMAKEQDRGGHSNFNARVNHAKPIITGSTESAAMQKFRAATGHGINATAGVGSDGRNLFGSLADEEWRGTLPDVGGGDIEHD